MRLRQAAGGGPARGRRKLPRQGSVRRERGLWRPPRATPAGARKLPGRAAGWTEAEGGGPGRGRPD